jgi:hypothetical protein
MLRWWDLTPIDLMLLAVLSWYGELDEVGRWASCGGA